jgi:hypothetical protein
MVKEVKKSLGPRKIDVLAIGLFVVLLIIGIVFFVMVGGPEFTGKGFGFGEIMLALAFAVFVAAFLIWCKRLILRNPYLGASIGILGVIALGYGFSLRYAGPRSLTFMFITGAIALGYLGFYFFRYMGREKVVDEFDES